jgi:hypothetical protein
MHPSQTTNVDAKHSVWQEIHGNQILIFNNPQEAEKAKLIFAWLSAPDPSSNQENAHDKRQDSAGAWLIEGQEFSDWKTDPSSFLVIYGNRTSL